MKVNGRERSYKEAELQNSGTVQHKMIPHSQQSSDLDSQQSSDLEYVSCAFRSKMSNYLLFKKEKSQKICITAIKLTATLTVNYNLKVYMSHIY